MQTHVTLSDIQNDNVQVEVLPSFKPSVLSQKGIERFQVTSQVRRLTKCVTKSVAFVQPGTRNFA